MATRNCWACGSRAHMTLVDVRTHDEHDPFHYDRVLVQGFYTCDQCHRGSIGAVFIPDNELRYGSASDSLETASTTDDLTWLPVHAIGKEFPDVPTHIAEPASEAYMCRSVDAFKSAILMARAVVEATAKNMGITKGVLEAKIDAMFEKKLISELIRDSAHEIRHLGNDMAHGDFALPQAEGDATAPTPLEMTATDADEILALMDMVLDEVFQKPAKVRKLREARKTKKQTGP